MAQGDVTIVHASGSTNGRMVKVVQTATPGTLLHTAIAGTADMDIVTIYVCNTSASAVDVTIELGGVTSPDDTVILAALASKRGFTLLVDRASLNNGVAIRAFASAANVIVAKVEVQRLELT